MRRLLLALATGCVLCAGSGPLGAQDKFALEYVDADANDPLVATGGLSALSSAKRPPALKALPKGVAAEGVVYFALPVAGKSVPALVEYGSGRLFVDASGTGDLSAAAPLAAAGPPGPRGDQLYGPVALAGGDGGTSASMKVRLRLERVVIRTGLLRRNAPPPPPFYRLTVLPAGYVAGEVRLAGRPYRAALVDSNLDGRYDRQRVSASRTSPAVADLLAFDVDRDGRFAESDAGGPGEILPVPGRIQAGDAYYDVTAAPDGSSIGLGKADLEFGTLDAGSADVALVLASEDATVCRLGRSQGKWQVPAGTWRLAHVSITQTDSAGATWTLRASRNLDKYAAIDVRPGKTTPVKVGPPLVAKVMTRPSVPGQVMISASVRGQADEEYAVSIFLLKDGRDAAPRLKVFDEAGKVLASAGFGFG